MSQSSYFISRPDPVTLEGAGGESLKSWKTLRVEGSECNLVGRIIKCRRCVIDVTGMDQLSLVELGVCSALASSVLLDVLGR